MFLFADYALPYAADSAEDGAIRARPEARKSEEAVPDLVEG